MLNIDLSVTHPGDRWVAIVRVEQDGRRTEHQVTVYPEDIRRYEWLMDVGDLVVRSFEFLLEREPNTSILREFRIIDIERYFAEYREWISAK